MHCPYCFEQVNDEAIVCRHCARPLDFFLPLLRRVSSLESKIAVLASAVDRFAGELQSAQGVAQLYPPTGKLMLGCVWVAALATVCNALFWTLSSPYDGYAIVGTQLAPVPVGVWLGAKYPGRLTGVFAVTGAAAGALGALAVAAMDMAMEVEVDPGDIIALTAISGVLGAIGFSVAARAGRFLGASSPGRSLPSVADHVSQVVAGWRWTPNQERVQRWLHAFGSVLTGIAPVLVFMLSFYVGEGTDDSPKQKAPPFPNASQQREIPEVERENLEERRLRSTEDRES